MKTFRVGLVGCGNISGIYLKNLTGRFHPARIVACTDLLPEKAEACAKQYGITAMKQEEMLASGDIDMVLNLTVPSEHARVTLDALQSGKHVYSEKTIALTLEDADRILDVAGQNGLAVGCAPDTFLGCGYQTAGKALRDNLIGRPVAATAFMTCRGHERWHPNPTFYYEEMVGPMFDMGPYYITAMVSMLGGVKAVTAMSSRAFHERTITSSPLYGKKIAVKTDTHYSISLLFENGAVANMMMSFDIWSANLPYIEIYGESGTMSCPDPNTFGGAVMFQDMNASEFTPIPEVHPYRDDSRGLGLAEMCSAIESGKPPRASGMLARHVLDVIHAVIRSCREGRTVECKPLGFPPEPLFPTETFY